MLPLMIFLMISFLNPLTGEIMTATISLEVFVIKRLADHAIP